MKGNFNIAESFIIGSVGLLYAQKKLGLVTHPNNEMPFKPYKWLLIVVSVVIRNTLGVYVFDSVLKKYPHMTSPITGLRDTKELFFNY